MHPSFDNQRHIRAWCSRCDAISTFEHGSSGKEFGGFGPDSRKDGFAFFRLYRCSGCHRGGLGEMVNVLSADENANAELVNFYPTSFGRAPLPPEAPEGVRREIEESAVCADAGANRGASALLRSALEKTLKANGYLKGSLKSKIDAAADDGVITSARRQRAHANVRDLGNDVVHDEWRPVDASEFASAYIYVQRIVEDFYEHRAEVEVVLSAAMRLPLPETQALSVITDGADGDAS